MASITLYNKWRPQTFADPARHPLIGQEHVTRTLRNAVARNGIAHAYLFCGPRGTGKTSAARILARAVNCRRGLLGEPCNECENCRALLSGRQLDLLIEIDGASNRGVDDVRQLRERLMQRPGGADLTGRFKVYIVDEVHMLTQEAFNALLKSLEEPPGHVVFVLATTDPQKVPATVASRCQRFDFKPISMETLVAHLTHVAAAEGVRLEGGAAELLARAAAGGARDAISLLDQALAFAAEDGAEPRPSAGPGGPVGGTAGAPLTVGAPAITLAHVQAMLGLTSFDAVCRLIDGIVAHDLAAGLRLVHEVASQGVDLRQFARQVLELLRALLLTDSNAESLLQLDEESLAAVRQRAQRLTLPDLVRLIKLFTQAEQGLKAPSAQPQLPLELAVVEATLAPQALAPAAAAPSVNHVAPPAPNLPPPTPAASATPSAPPPAPSNQLPTSAPTAPAPHVAPPVAAAPAAVEPRTASAVPAAIEPPAALTAPTAPGAVESLAASAALDVVPEEPPQQASPPPVPVTTGAAQITFDQVQARWPAVLEAVRQRSPSVAALLSPRDATPVRVEEPNVLVLEFRHDFHRKKIQDAANLLTVEKALRSVLGKQMRVRCVQKEGATLPFDRPRSQTAGDDPVVAKALRIWRAHIMSPSEVADVEALPTVPDLTRF